MTEQMLDIRNGSTSTQQPGSKRLSQVMGGNVSNTSPLKRRFQCPIILDRFVSSEVPWKESPKTSS